MMERKSILQPIFLIHIFLSRCSANFTSIADRSKQNIRNRKVVLLLKNFPMQQPLRYFKNFISTYFFQICHLLLGIKLMKKFRLSLKVQISIDTKQTGHLLSNVSIQYFLKSCVIFSIYLQLIDSIRTLSDANLRLCLKEHSAERRITQ